MPELRIHVRTHHFVVRDFTLRAEPAIYEFARKFIQFGSQRLPNGSYTKIAMRTYAASTRDRREFRFHINQLAGFKEVLKKHYLTDDRVEFIKTPLYAPKRVDLPVLPQWQPREHQHAVLEFMNTVPPFPFPQDYTAAKLVSIQTGKGKSFCEMFSASHYGYRMVMFIKPMYIEKWIEDIKKTYDVDEEDILVIQGGASLMQALEDAENDEIRCKVIIVSNKTFQNYIKAYELFRDQITEHGYAFGPEEFHEKMGIGFRGIDEVHQDYHLNFKIDLYTHCPVSISLSATLTSYDQFLESVYEIGYPKVVRYDKMEYHKYVSARGLIWGLQHPEKVKYKNGGNYSHNVFEQSILKYKGMTSNYLELFKKQLDIDFIPDKRDGDRALIFCASIDMCTVVTDYLKKQYPNLDVRRYVEKDPYENAMEPDIIVSTMLSAGTALDIPNLRFVFMSTCMSSKQGNIQGFGRLRFIAGVTLRFIFLACESIPKQMAYYEEKKLLLRDRAEFFRTDYYRTPV
jgi:hypothetical protein